jgi:hypothetical protein
MKMKAKGYSAGGAPKSRAQRRATLSALKNCLWLKERRKAGKRNKDCRSMASTRQRAGAKGGGKGKGKATRHEHGRCAMASPGTTAQRLPPSGGPKAIDGFTPGKAWRSSSEPFDPTNQGNSHARCCGTPIRW